MVVKLIHSSCSCRKHAHLEHTFVGAFLLALPYPMHEYLFVRLVMRFSCIASYEVRRYPAGKYRLFLHQLMTARSCAGYRIELEVERILLCFYTMTSLKCLRCEHSITFNNKHDHELYDRTLRIVATP